MVARRDIGCLASHPKRTSEKLHPCSWNFLLPRRVILVFSVENFYLVSK